MSWKPSEPSKKEVLSTVKEDEDLARASIDKGNVALREIEVRGCCLMAARTSDPLGCSNVPAFPLASQKLEKVVPALCREFARSSADGSSSLGTGSHSQHSPQDAFLTTLASMKRRILTMSGGPPLPQSNLQGKSFLHYRFGSKDMR